MTSKTLLLLAALMLAGCEPPEQSWYTDQTVRREVFMQCLEKAPAGPQITKYNDWAEVIDECGTQADNIATTGKYYRQAAKVEQ